MLKIKPRIYAQLLLESLSSVISTQADSSAGEKSYRKGATLSSIAERFWNLLQKNKQYRELPKILDELERLYARKSGSVIAYIESGKELSEKELEEIRKKLLSYCHPELVSGSQEMPKQVRHDNIIVKVKINPAITGITAKIDDQVVDLSVENKILKLRKKLNS